MSQATVPLALSLFAHSKLLSNREMASSVRTWLHHPGSVLLESCSQSQRSILVLPSLFSFFEGAVLIKWHNALISIKIYTPQSRRRHALDRFVLKKQQIAATKHCGSTVPEAPRVLSKGRGIKPQRSAPEPVKTEQIRVARRANGGFGRVTGRSVRAAMFCLFLRAHDRLHGPCSAEALNPVAEASGSRRPVETKSASKLPTSSPYSTAILNQEPATQAFTSGSSKTKTMVSQRGVGNSGFEDLLEAARDDSGSNNWEICLPVTRGLEIGIRVKTCSVEQLSLRSVQHRSAFATSSSYHCERRQSQGG